VNQIRYDTEVACGSSPVLIRNLATAGLYNYTPYQPNAAALANLYGTGDSCSAYGNRNTWRIWTDWFGDPTEPLPSAQRIAGADRYATSAAVAQRSLSDGVVSSSATWLATGNAFPDALSAGALAARTGGIVVLVDGSLSRGDGATRDFLARSGATLAGVLGGPAAVDPAVGWVLAPVLGLL
jgi:hypothetical protein